MGKRVKRKSKPPCHHRARKQLTAYLLFPQLRLQGLRVRSTMGMGSCPAEGSLEVGVQGTCPLHFSGRDMGSRASMLNISKQGPQP